MFRLRSMWHPTISLSQPSVRVFAGALPSARERGWGGATLRFIR